MIILTNRLRFMINLFLIVFIIFNLFVVSDGNFAKAQNACLGNPLCVKMFDKLDDAGGETYGTPENDPRTIAYRIINYLLTFLGLAAIVLIIYGGFMWMTSAGSAERVTKAKGIIIHACIGLAIILLAYVITYIIFYIILIEGTKPEVLDPIENPHGDGTT